MKIPLTRPYFTSDEFSEIKGVLESGWVSQGPKVKEFESLVSDYLGIENVIAVSNCTTGLHISLICSSIGKGDQVIVPDFTFPATGHSVSYVGAEPVFVDVNPTTYNIDTSKIIERINDKTKAIIPVHTFGNPAEMDKINEIAESYNLKVIEDAACGFGSEINSQKVGTFGDVGVFSLHGRKGITTGEGGLVITKDNDLANRLRSLACFGMNLDAWTRDNSNIFTIPEFTELGFNYKMSDVAAALGIAQLRKNDKIIERKNELARIWLRNLESVDGIILPEINDKARHIFQSFVINLEPNINRNYVIQKLREEGIQSQIGYYSSYVQPVYKSESKCPISLNLFKQSLALPMYYELKKEEIEYVCSKLSSIIGEFYGK